MLAASKITGTHPNAQLYVIFLKNQWKNGTQAKPLRSKEVTFLLVEGNFPLQR